MPVKAQSLQLVQIRNLQPGPTVFQDDEHNVQVVWEGAGDPSGGDIQQVAESLLHHPQIDRMLRIGVLAKSNQQDAAEAFHKQEADRATAKQTSDLMAGALIEATTSKDILGLSCVGPGPRAGAMCAQQVILVANQVDTVPPLCPRHLHLAQSFRRSGTTWIPQGDPSA